MKSIESDQIYVIVLDDSDNKRYCGIRLFDNQNMETTNVPVTNQITNINRPVRNISYTNLVNKVTDLCQLVKNIQALCQMVMDYIRVWSNTLILKESLCIIFIQAPPLILTNVAGMKNYFYPLPAVAQPATCFKGKKRLKPELEVNCTSSVYKVITYALPF